ncbi:uncharacterized protein LOC126657754 [Mercurialis annua]|uniref:uncharacterized protein LOC126657754 n=1 Tax=Mercurialis annua TaxID=3986 RepID=UPI00215F3211|nr:uncharacterized protein LOC126657754 [Mercurialis annua]
MTMQESLETQSNPNPVISIFNNDQNPKLSPYEQSRNDRIKSNLERMQNLGLVNLSRQLNSLTSPKRTPRNNPSSEKYCSPLPPSGPTRRSSRLHNATPVSYSEAALTKRDGLWEDKGVRLEEGSKPEVYTEEHEKLLGNTERSWTLFVDGCGSDGKRVYDQVKGKTCHQCRQKTLGHRTHCCKCQLVQGQFCGDCLYMRYGEHVLEALEDPNWICPACRGICNCSLCRQAKGWAPTGALYRKISSLGYKSVAHYLIQTRRSQTTGEVNLPTVNQVSAKRSLPFSDMETPSNMSPHIKDEQSKQLMAQSEDTKHDDELKSVKEEGLPYNRNLSTAGQNEKEKPPPNSANLESYGQENIPVSGNDTQSGILEPLGSELKNEKDGKLLDNGNLDAADQNEKE